MKAPDLYRSAPLGTRLHTRLRWWWCPFDALEAAVPSAGDVLEIGCGHGLCSLHLALAAPGRAVVGVDIDADKVADAQRAAEGLPAAARARFEAVDPGWQPEPSGWDAVVFADVLYLLPEDDQRTLVQAAARAVRPGGIVVLKELALTPRWKLRWQRIQETLATRVFRVTDSVGRGLTFVGTDAMAGWLRDAGLDAVVERLDRGYPWPHSLVVATRP